MIKFLHSLIKNKTFSVFLILTVLAAVITCITASFYNDQCNSGISPFEDKYCGTEGKSPEDLRYDQIYFNYYDLTLHPFVLLYPPIFSSLHLVEDVYVEYHIADFSHWESIGASTLLPWFSVEIDTFHRANNDTISRGIIFILLWIPDIIYWCLLAFIFDKLWKNKKWWGKTLVSIFYTIKLLPIIIIFLFH